MGLASAENLLDSKSAFEALFVAVVVSDGFFRVAPAVVAFAVVEVDEPKALGLEAEGLDFCRPVVHNIAERRREVCVIRIFLLQAMQLRGKRLSSTDRIRRHVLDMGEKVARLLQRENRPGLGTHTDDYNWRFPMRMAAAALSLVLTVSAGAATAQTVAPNLDAPGIGWPPLRSSDGTLLIGGEIVGTLGSTDDTAFFNYTDYEHNALRLMRLALAGQWRPMARVALIAEIRSEDLSRVDTHAAYVRFRPWQSHAFDIQAGRIPPSFGAYGRRAYNADNPLIGYPLAYQYLTSLRADAIPNTVDDLLRMRGRGWQPSFPVGSTSVATGLPLVSAFRWDTGVQGRWSGAFVEATAAVTAGTLSDPRFADNNGGRQISGRVAVKPMIGLLIGASAARGAWLSDDVTALLPTTAQSRSYSQRALGVDAEYSRAHWLVRGEVVWSGWQMPFMAVGETHRLDACGMWIEGRYRLSPRFFVAARGDRLTFSRIAGTVFGGLPVTWDAPVDRVETGLGWYLLRNLVGRAVVQRNWRDGGRVRSRTYVSGQLAYWF